MAHRNLRSTTVLLGLSVLALGACASQAAPAHEGAASAQPPSEVAVASAAPRAPEAQPPLELRRALHDASMSEVVLDAHARAAVTLDTEGTVRLWPSLDAESKAPLALPVREPSWMSIARADDGFVLAFIDTAGGGRVVHVQADGSEATMETLFEIPATEPLFELHVLDGGDRIVALAHDHRISLYDREGTERSAIDPVGFVPWQLRLQQVPGQEPSLVAVLVGPTRIQPISLRGNELALSGEARAIEIDQGPNRNDLSLSPDGKTMVAMRRPKARGRRLTLELVDLPTNARRLMAVELDTRERPRVHLVDADRILLESSSGKGFWLDVSQAIPWEQGTTREETEDVAELSTTEVPLPASSEVRRMHTTVVNGLRAVPTTHALVMDPIDDDRHLELGATPLRPDQVALDATGSQVAWVTNQGLVLEGLETGEPPRVVPVDGPRVVELAFLDDAKLLTLDQDGRAAIRDEDGQVLSKTKLPMGWGISSVGFRKGERSGTGTLGLLPLRKGDGIAAVDVVDGGFGEVQELPRWSRVRFDQMGTRTRDVRGVVEALGFDEIPSGSIDQMVEDGRGGHLIVNASAHPVLFRVTEQQAEPIPLRAGKVMRLTPSPDGMQVAVVQHADSNSLEGFRSAFGRRVVSVIDLGTQQRLWSRVVTGGVDLDWSQDGGRLGMASVDGGQVIDAQSGELLLARRDLGLKVSEVEGS